MPESYSDIKHEALADAEEIPFGQPQPCEPEDNEASEPPLITGIPAWSPNRCPA